ncbi:amino acid ABC transporter permease [Lachnoclostridium sp. Marseille-P6806]|uniref:amino acid ABC transporter permease n=1 Tax=Lachnoclostridium sp. Marseille-P6806 TaxID=2364793 RepID=UPI001030E05F|nr:amino acid ABC transporter permease [Lachnoclostridium sp. Marseille-P6806]
MDAHVIEVMAEAFPQLLIKGLYVTIPLTAISFSLAMVIAVAVALIQYARVPVLRHLARFYIWMIRGTPLLVQLYVVFFGLPGIGVMTDPFLSAVIVLAVNAGAYDAETIRGALEAVPSGQAEAGQCLGLGELKIMRYIVLPQAFRSAFPALGNSLIAMVKDTSLAANITVAEMFFQAQRIAGRTYETMALYLETAFIYLMFSTILSFVQRYGEKRLGKYGIQ